MYDFHIHMRSIEYNNAQRLEFKRRTAAAGIEGGAVFSLSPYWKDDKLTHEQLWKKKLDGLLDFSAEVPDFLPVFYFDPTAPDAEEQIKTAAERGVKAFKIICMHFYPEEILPQMKMIAGTGLPVIFHSGILYSIRPAGKYNRPVNFECLINIPDLKFSLAHMSWPWTAELVSIVGEFAFFSNQQAYYNIHDAKSAAMYVDLTPGTPAVFRKNALREYFLTGYPEIENRTVWGTDGNVDDYNTEYAAQILQKDREHIAGIIKEAGEYEISAVRYADLFDKVMKNNFKAFFGIDG